MAFGPEERLLVLSIVLIVRCVNYFFRNLK